MFPSALTHTAKAPGDYSHPRSLRAADINLWTRTPSHKVLFAQLNFRTQSGFAGLEVAEALPASWSAAKLRQKFLFSSV